MVASYILYEMKVYKPLELEWESHSNRAINIGGKSLAIVKLQGVYYYDLL